MVKTATLLLAICASHVSLAQMASKPAPPSRTRFVTFAEGQKSYSLAEVQQVLREQLALKPTDSFKRIRTTTDERGGVHERYAQYYQGVPVENGLYLVHARQGRILSLNGDYEPIGKLDVTVSVPEAQALRQVLQPTSADRVSWRPLPGQKPGTAAQLVSLSKGELVIVSSLTPALNVAAPALAWKFDVGTEQAGSRALCYVDAHSGQVLGRVPLGADFAPSFSLAKPASITATVPAVGETFWHGPRNMLTQAVPGGNILRTEDASGNWHIWTIGWDYSGGPDNMANALPPPSWLRPGPYFYNYFNRGTYWARGALTEAGATDIHWGTQMAEAFYAKYFRRNGYDNNGSPVLNVVKYDSPGSAQWTPPTGPGSTLSPVGATSALIRYGHGIVSGASLASIDVIGHEYGHGVYWSTMSGAQASQDEPGAINEGMSDIWGACLTAFIGEQHLMWGYGLRNYPYFARPLDDPKSNNLPDTYKGTYYDSTPGAAGHRNATIMSHWFYLLSQGGSGVNDMGRPYNITGIGWESAAALVYMMETNYLTPTGNFKACRGAATTSAWYLFGFGPEYTAVTEAWDAVNVTGYDNDRVAGGGTTAANALYPNPAVASTTVELPTAPAQPVQARLYNTHGQVVKTVVLDQATNTVNVRDVQPGLYYLRYEQNGKAQSRMLRIER